MPRGGKKRSWTDDELIQAVKSSDSMAEMVRKLGLSATTNRAVRARIGELGLDTSHFPSNRPSDQAHVFTADRLREIVPTCTSYSQVVRSFGRRPVGSMVAHVQRRVIKFGISTEHFRTTTAGRSAHNRRDAKSVLRLMPEGSLRESTARLRRAMAECGVQYRCVQCGNPGEWNGRPLVLHIDHKNGEWIDNRIENLRFLCPNCHSQTDNWCLTKRRRRHSAGGPSSSIGRAAG